MKTLLFALLCLINYSAFAGETWLTVPFASWHENRERVENGKSRGHYEQTNLGLGVEYALNPKWRLAAGVYRNSIRTDTGYVGLGYFPLEVYGARLGTSAGVVSGYSGNLLPVLIPTVAFEGKNVGMNVMLVPPTNVTKTAGAGFVFKIKLP